MTKFLAIFILCVCALPAAAQDNTSVQDDLALKRELAELVPVVRRWTRFHRIDLREARRADEDLLPIADFKNWRRDDNFYEFENSTPATNYETTYDSDRRIDVSYSSDGRRYVDMGLFYAYEKQANGAYYGVHWDDATNLFFVDLDERYACRFLYFGMNGGPSDVFWVSNDVFVVVGGALDWRSEKFMYFVCRIDLVHRTQKVWSIAPNPTAPQRKRSYVDRIYWPSKGIRTVTEKQMLRRERRHSGE